MSKISKFQKSSGSTYVCHDCGKKTRETGSNESAYSLCKKCFDEREKEEK